MRRTLLPALLLAATSLPAANVRIHGHITVVSSPLAFEIADYRIARPDSLAFDVDKGNYPDATFRPEDLRVGTEVEVDGNLDDSSHQLTAEHIKVFVTDNLRVKRFTVVEHDSTLQHDSDGWSGVIRADGQTIRLDSQTRLNLKEGQTNRISPGLSISYEGTRQRDGSILASRVEILPNVGRREGQKLWRDITPKVNADGEVIIHGAKYKLAPDAEAQSYVQRIGSKLVPSFYRQDLSDGAARRLAFQFFLVENPDFNAHAFPNGAVLINTGVFRILTSEAQFAAVLGHEIAHATQEHAILDLQHQKKNAAGSVHEKGYAGGTKGDPLVTGYSRQLENQADRIGLEYMIAAGYDPREAAQVWKEVASTTANPKAVLLWNAREDATFRRSYLLSELSINYSASDFHAFVRNQEEFDILAERFGNTIVARRRSSENPNAGASKLAFALRPGYVPPAPPKQETRFGANFVTITSDPAGAQVFVNGQAIGATPLNLPTGSVGLPFTVTVRMPGYRDWTGQLVSVPGKTNLRVDMFRVQ